MDPNIELFSASKIYHSLSSFDRPLIRPQHQQTYDKITPSAPGTKSRIIKLRRRGNESFGFAVRGGNLYIFTIFLFDKCPIKCFFRTMCPVQIMDILWRHFDVSRNCHGESFGHRNVFTHFHYKNTLRKESFENVVGKEEDGG